MKRPLRDLLGEALRLALHDPATPVVPWSAERAPQDETLENWRREADRLLHHANRLGIDISER